VDERILIELQNQLASLYMPAPGTALRERPKLPVRTDHKSHPRGIAWRVTTAADTELPIYSSPSLDTKGYTLQNVFCSLRVSEDNDADEVLRIFCVLEGSYSSAWCELARSGLLPYTGPGNYTFGLVGTDVSLATQIRFRIVGGAPRTTGNRVLRVHIDAMLAAGYQF